MSLADEHLLDEGNHGVLLKNQIADGEINTISSHEDASNIGIKDRLEEHLLGDQQSVLLFSMMIICKELKLSPKISSYCLSDLNKNDDNKSQSSGRSK